MKQYLSEIGKAANQRLLPLTEERYCEAIPQKRKGAVETNNCAYREKEMPQRAEYIPHTVSQGRTDNELQKMNTKEIDSTAPALWPTWSARECKLSSLMSLLATMLVLARKGLSKDLDTSVTIRRTS